MNDSSPALRAGKGRSALLADVGQQSHEAGPLDGVLDGALEGGAVAGALAAEHLALAGAELLQGRHVFVIDEGRPRTTLFGAEPAAVLATPPELLPNHAVNALFPRECAESRRNH